MRAQSTLEQGINERRNVNAGDDGRFDVELPAGWVRVEAWVASGDRAPVWNRTLASGAVVDDVKLVVGPGEVLRGTVRTAGGVPVVGARVRLSAATWVEGITASDGSFEVTVPERIAYIVTIRHSDGYLQTTIPEWGDSQSFVMPRFGALRVTIAGATGDARLHVDSFVPAGLAAPRAPVEATFHGSPQLVEASTLEPGHYRVTVSAAGGADRTVELDVEPEVTGELAVDLGSGPRDL
jgi:hypothetical protein